MEAGWFKSGRCVRLTGELPIVIFLNFGPKIRLYHMRFWKFETPPQTELEECIRDGRLPSDVNVPGLKNTHAYPTGKLRVGDGLLIASLVGDEARIVALGKIKSIDESKRAPIVQWAATTHTRFPDARGGLMNWQTKTAFEISKEPAERYGLRALLDYYVKEPA